MVGFPIGALISAGASIFGASRDRSETRKLHAEQRAAEERLNKNRVQWLVEDAKKAGINPLAALGSPVAGSFASPVPSGQSRSGSTIADGFGALGRGIDRMMREKTHLENDLLRAQIGNVNADTAGKLSDATSRTAIQNQNGVRALPNIGPLPAGADPEGAQKAEDYSEFVKYLLYEPTTLWKHLDNYFRNVNPPEARTRRYRRNFQKGGPPGHSLSQPYGG